MQLQSKASSPSIESDSDQVVDMESILASVILPASSITDAIAKNQEQVYPFPVYLAPSAYQAFRNCFLEKKSLAEQGKSCLSFKRNLTPSSHNPPLGMVKSKGKSFLNIK
jgi:hypothetical protein